MEDEKSDDDDDHDSEILDEEAAAGSLLYVTMPTLDGLNRVLALWRRFKRDEPKPSDAKEWWSLFGYLSDVRVWSAKDRVDPVLQAFVDRSIQQHPDRPVRLELDLWFRDNEDLRKEALGYVEALLDTIEGTLLDFATIDPIRYQAALIEVPGYQAQALRNLSGPIANAERVMRIRPQSLYNTQERDPGPRGGDARTPPTAPDGRPAIAALIDGYPIERHELLDNRLDVKEVDITGRDVPVARRYHGTSMASLIIHGDLGDEQSAITRTLKVVPILAAPQAMHSECTPPEKLPLALVYRAVLALVEGIDGKAAMGSEVVIINHSICDQQGSFARRPSPWAKLLDYLSHEYRLLFIVSAGNIHQPFPIDTYHTCEEFVEADDLKREAVLLRALELAKGGRVILSPAESVNALTVGAVHEDAAGDVPDTHHNPFAFSGAINLGSSVGLGVNRSVKPDLVEAGGRQMASYEEEGGVVSIWGTEVSSIGQLTASPDPFGGDLTKQVRSTGTSNAAALVTRSAIQIADMVEQKFAEVDQNWLLEPTRAVALKALLAHGCSWGDVGKLLNKTYPPAETKRWARRREAISRFLGFGRANHSRVLTADGTRITLLADDMIGHDERHRYSIPIPRAMIANKEIRHIVLTLAWSSPTNPDSARYKGYTLGIVDADGKRNFWTGVNSVLQPSADAGRRGTLQHIVLEGSKLIREAGTGSIALGVQARAAIAEFEGESIPYALVVSLEISQPLRQDLFADVAARVRAKNVAPVRPTLRNRIRNR